MAAIEPSDSTSPMNREVGKVMRTILAGIAMVCLATSVVLWFMIPAVDRHRIRIAPWWKQRHCFSSARNYHLYVAGIALIDLGSTLFLIHFLI